MTAPSTITIACARQRTFSCPPSRTALLIIDMQRDFCCEGGYGAVTGGNVAPLRAIIPNVERALAFAREAGWMVVHTREGHVPELSDCPQAKLERSRRGGAEIGSNGPLGRFLIRGEAGHDFVEELQPLPGEVVIDKPGFGAFYKTELESLLRKRGITHLIFSGVTTDVCVHSTLREAVDRGFYCLLLEDCCAAFDQELHRAAVRTVHGEGGIFGSVSTSEKLAEAIDANHVHC